MKVRRDPKNAFRTTVQLEPPFRLKNCLPKPVLFQILSHSKKTTLTREIATGEVYEEFRHSQNKKIYLKINMPGFFWSQEHQLVSCTTGAADLLQADSASDLIQYIPIKDINGNESLISVH